MSQQQEKPGLGWKKWVVLGLVVLASVFIYFEQPAPPLNQDGLVLTTQSVSPKRDLQPLFRQD